jgi:hypothetical protein
MKLYLTLEHITRQEVTAQRMFQAQKDKEREEEAAAREARLSRIPEISSAGGGGFR